MRFPFDKYALLRCFTLVAWTMVLAGCGPQSAPEDTQRPVQKEDILGSWRYDSGLGFPNVTDLPTSSVITFYSDGSYMQMVASARGEQATTGTWSLDGATLRAPNLMEPGSVLFCLIVS